ncbi:MAG: metallophosphoesterase, partial [Bacteroidota bacterium]
MKFHPRNIRDRWRSKRPYYHRSERNWHKHPSPDLGEIAHSVLLIGDMGAPALEKSDAILTLVEQQMRLVERNTTVIFLGDNVYPRGLPPEGHSLRQLSEQRLNVQLDIFKDFDGHVHFISGNHDWNKGRSDGYAYLLRQEEYIEHYLKRPDVYLPDNGCPGPTLIDLTDNVLLIVINTQWWVQRGIRPAGKSYRCQARSEDDFLRLLNQAFEENKHREILVVGHHPLY